MRVSESSALLLSIGRLLFLHQLETSGSVECCIAEPAINVPSPSENQHSLLTSFDLVQLCLPFTSVLAQLWVVKCCETISHFLVTPIGPMTTYDNL